MVEVMSFRGRMGIRLGGPTYISPLLSLVSLSLFLPPPPFLPHAIPLNFSSLLQFSNEKKLVGKSWTDSYINLQTSHGTAQGERER